MKKTSERQKSKLSSRLKNKLRPVHMEYFPKSRSPLKLEYKNFKPVVHVNRLDEFYNRIQTFILTPDEAITLIQYISHRVKT